MNPAQIYAEDRTVHLAAMTQGSLGEGRGVGKGPVSGLLIAAGPVKEFRGCVEPSAAFVFTGERHWCTHNL